MNILVAVDSSSTSVAASREAAARLWPAGSIVRVITVVEPIYGWSVPEIEEALEQAAEQTVQCAAEYFKQAGLETTTAVLMGDPKGADFLSLPDAGSISRVGLGSPFLVRYVSGD